MLFNFKIMMMRLRFHCLLHSYFVVSAFPTEGNPHNPAARQCQRDALVTHYQTFCNQRFTTQKMSRFISKMGRFYQKMGRFVQKLLANGPIERPVKPTHFGTNGPIERPVKPTVKNELIGRTGWRAGHGAGHPEPEWLQLGPGLGVGCAMD